MPTAPDDQEAERIPVESKRSHTEILKSSALIGASTGVVILVGIVRTKIMAIILGPAGFGVMGIFNSIVDLGTAVASMGVGGSGVRQIAESAGVGDSRRIVTTVWALRRLSLVLAALGGIMTVFLSEFISIATFGTDDYAIGIAGLGVAVAFRVVAAGQGALVQGMRRIADVAMIGLTGAVLGSVAAVTLVWRFGSHGIAAAVGAMALGTLAASWWFSRRILTSNATVDKLIARSEIAALLSLGAAFMASGLLTLGAAYAVRAMVVRWAGVDAAGYYQAAWTIGGMYVGIILQAMGVDFYPRLASAATNHSLMNRMVNEQTVVGVLLAAPGVVATLGFAPFFIVLLYSREFAGATEVLQWIGLGMALRVISWPMGYTIIAKGSQRVFITTELAWAVVNVGLAAILVPRFGAVGAGMAFAGSYVFHLFMIYLTARWLTGFRWSLEALRGIIAFLSFVTIVFVGIATVPPRFLYVVGILALAAGTFVSMRQLAALVEEDQVPQRFRVLLRLVRNGGRSGR